MSKKYALISVSNKNGLTDLVKGLIKAGYEIISTGGTAKALSEFGVTSIESITNFPECMDGRLKTLHPRIAGGLLGLRDNDEHCRTMAEHNIPAIDVLVVNLYPFKEESTIENIDIGGPTMIRAGAKNYKYVAVVTDPADYDELLQRIDNMDEAFRYKLAAKAFRHTADYDAYIARHLSEEIFPETLTLSFRKQSDMRYGENPQQTAAYYVEDNENFEVIHGKALSFNNIADANAAVALVREFTDQVACVAVKHATPCGAAVASTVFEAYKATYDCDPVSIFGGIVAFNREVDEATAKLMHEIFLEVIIAPAFSAGALEILTKKKNLRLIILSDEAKQKLEFKSVHGGMLIQETDSNSIDSESHTVVTEKSPENMDDLLFAMKVVKHVKSNAIVVAKDGRLLGQGGGEVSRIWAAQAALTRSGDAAKGAVVASDALIPFPDVVEACAKHGISAIIQPGGSKNDQMAIDACNKSGIAMVLTGVRHFKH